MSSLLKNILSGIAIITLLPLIPALFSGISSLYQHYFDPRTAVAVVPIKGVLYDSGSTVKNLQQYFQDDSIKAIVLKLECMGSTSGTGQAIFYEINELKKEHPKPVIALVENICASGGYYIACAADHIVATPSALVGSIGVRFPTPAYFQLKEFIEKHNIKYDPLAAGDYKIAGDMFTDRKPEHKKMLQGLLDDTYDQFVTDVATSRKISPADAPQWANGRIFTGRQALKLGLVDQLGATSTAIKVVKEKAFIEGEIRWVHPAHAKGLMRFITGENDEESGLMSKLVNECCSIIETRYCQPKIQ